MVREALVSGLLHAAALCVLAGLARAETVEVVAALDNTLFESTTGSSSNGAGPYILVGQNNQGNDRRGVVAFDLAGVLPGNAVIDSVSLRLHLSNPLDTTERSLSVHRLLASWGEIVQLRSGAGCALHRR
jgi:hypothetical protein